MEGTALWSARRMPGKGMSVNHWWDNVWWYPFLPSKPHFPGNAADATALKTQDLQRSIRPWHKPLYTTTHITSRTEVACCSSGTPSSMYTRLNGVCAGIFWQVCLPGPSYCFEQRFVDLQSHVFPATWREPSRGNVGRQSHNSLRWYSCRVQAFFVDTLCPVRDICFTQCQAYLQRPRPSELSVVTSPSADLDQLVAIARIANKYAFKSTETWILDAVQKFVDQKPSPVSPIIHASPYGVPFTHLAANSVSYNPKVVDTEQLTRIIRLAQTCNHERLLSTMIQLLKDLMIGSVQYAYLAMTLADELGLRTLRGVAYLEVMQKAVIVRSPSIDIMHNAPGTSQPSLVSDGNTLPGNDNQSLSDVEDKKRISLTSQQQLRLLAGYYRLTETWEELRRTPPHFEHALSCGATWHQHGCAQSWSEFWKEKTRGDALLNLGLTDVIGRLKQISKEHDRWGTVMYMHHECRQAARRSINEIINRVEDSLPDYFSDADLSDWYMTEPLYSISVSSCFNIKLSYFIHPSLRDFPLRLLFPTVEVVVPPKTLSISAAPGFPSYDIDWFGIWIFQGPSNNVSSITRPTILPVDPSDKDMSRFIILFINTSISFVDGRVSNPTCEPRNIVCSNSSSSSNFRISVRKFLIIFSTIAAGKHPS